MHIESVREFDRKYSDKGAHLKIDQWWPKSEHISVCEKNGVIREQLSGSMASRLGIEINICLKQYVFDPSMASSLEKEVSRHNSHQF